jgi:hypothetical protein
MKVKAVVTVLYTAVVEFDSDNWDQQFDSAEELIEAEKENLSADVDSFLSGQPNQMTISVSSLAEIASFPVDDGAIDPDESEDDTV